MAERLLDINRWADMVRFARTGGEANAIAIRIARAATSKSKVAICGYHGWHDWYLSANLMSDDSLGGHHLGVFILQGVPKELGEPPFHLNIIISRKIKEYSLRSRYWNHKNGSDEK